MSGALTRNNHPGDPGFPDRSLCRTVPPAASGLGGAVIMELHGPTPRTPEEYLIQIYAAVQELRAQGTAQSTRLAAIEGWVWYIRGIGAVLGVVSGSLIGHLLRLV